jgi:hypothetical protein
MHTLYVFKYEHDKFMVRKYTLNAELDHWKYCSICDAIKFTFPLVRSLAILILWVAWT